MPDPPILDDGICTEKKSHEYSYHLAATHYSECAIVLSKKVRGVSGKDSAKNGVEQKFLLFVNSQVERLGKDKNIDEHS
jgi:hypothetical protein